MCDPRRRSDQTSLARDAPSTFVQCRRILITRSRQQPASARTGRDVPDPRCHPASSRDRRLGAGRRGRHVVRRPPFAPEHAPVAASTATSVCDAVRVTRYNHLHHPSLVIAMEGSGGRPQLAVPRSYQVTPAISGGGTAQHKTGRPTVDRAGKSQPAPAENPTGNRSHQRQPHHPTSGDGSGTRRP